MADNTAQNATDTLRTKDRAGIKTGVSLLDVAQSAEAERMGLSPSSAIVVSSAGLTTATTAYIAGDTLGTELSFASASRASGLSGQAVSAMLIDKANIVGAVDLYLFDRASTPAVDNAANSWADADMAHLMGIVNFGTPISSANNRAAVAMGGLPVNFTPNVSTLFGVLVTRTGHTFFGATSDLVVVLGVIPD